MIEKWINQFSSFIWGPPLLILLVGTGILFTICLKGVQFYRLVIAFKLIFKTDHNEKGDVSRFGSLATALAATIGTGNIVGIATAIKLGGPGALFWIWIAAFFGMATKYAEGLLAVKYRTFDENGEVLGGPMYYIEKGLGKIYRPLAICFATSGVLVALFGIGTFPQMNAIVYAAEQSLNIPTIVTAPIITIITALVTIGGIKTIANITTTIVPIMAFVYFGASLFVLIIFADRIPQAIALIFNSAFHPISASGGFIGATVMMAIRSGIARGVFSNESGLGSAPIAAAAAKVKWPAEQGLISMTATFIDTIIICSLTGLTLLVTDTWSSSLEGVAMTQAAFAAAFPYGSSLIMLCLILFAFTTIIGWNYYGERCVVYLFGITSILPYRILFIGMISIGAFIKLDFIWKLADIVNGLMALPNLVALLGLVNVVVAETRSYWIQGKR